MQVAMNYNHMVVGFTSSYTITDFCQWSCKFDFRGPWQYGIATDLGDKSLSVTCGRWALFSATNKNNRHSITLWNVLVIMCILCHCQQMPSVLLEKETGVPRVSPSVSLWQSFIKVTYFCGKMHWLHIHVGSCKSCTHIFTAMEASNL
jgi:hypothetical protein